MTPFCAHTRGRPGRWTKRWFCLDCGHYFMPAYEPVSEQDRVAHRLMQQREGREEV